MMASMAERRRSSRLMAPNTRRFWPETKTRRDFARRRRARDLGVLAVEMEAAALFAFSAATGHPVVCFAHVTNAMAQTEGDFEKGEADGAKATRVVLSATARAWFADRELD